MFVPGSPFPLIGTIKCTQHQANMQILYYKTFYRLNLRIVVIS